MDPRRDWSSWVHRVRSSCRSRSRVRGRSSSFSASCSSVVRGGDIAPMKLQIFSASLPCPACKSASAAACQPAITSRRVSRSLVFPAVGSRSSVPSFRARRSARSRRCLESPRNQARWMPSLKPDRLCPLTARSVALAATPRARKCCANCPRHSRSVAVRILSRSPCSLTALSHVSNCSLFGP